MAHIVTMGFVGAVEAIGLATCMGGGSGVSLVAIIRLVCQGEITQCHH